MSKDKGQKNVKKAPAEKTGTKKVSDYKSETKSKSVTTAPSVPKNKP